MSGCRSRAERSQRPSGSVATGEHVTGAIPVPVVSRFDNRVAQRVMAGYSALIIFIGFGGLSAPGSRGQGVFFVAFGVFSLVRARRSARVEVDTAGVLTRSMFRTHRYLFQDLATVEVAVGRTGLNGFGREYLVLRRKDGEVVAFKELNCRPSPGEATVVGRAAACIQERLSGR